MSDRPVLECVPNVSTADPDVVRYLAEALVRPPEVRLIHATSDARHGRTVFTVLGAEEPLADALVDLGRRCAERIDLSAHDGLHPRVGALDVVPLVPLHPERPPETAAETARALAARLADEAGLTTCAYGAADPSGRSLPDLRRGGPTRLLRRIDGGEVPAWHPAGSTPADRDRSGVTCVGARGVLVAFNVELDTGELRLARRIAGQLREATGGLPAVRALGLKLGPHRVQVSMNLIDHRRTGVAKAFDAVEQLAREAGAAVVRSELIGCVPAAAWPEGTSARVREPELAGEGLESRTLETWLPGGARADEPGLTVADLPQAPVEAPATMQSGEDVEALPPIRVLDLPLSEAADALGALVAELGERSYRVGQVLTGIHRHGRRRFEDMTDLPLGLREGLARRARVGLLELAERATSEDGTVKYLWRLPDGGEVESVAIPSERRTTFCVSCQVGCSLKCRFCATGQLGFGRNLSPGEIVDQCLAMRADVDAAPDSLNVVFMGMGEPGHSMKSVLQACRTLNAQAGLGIGARRITVSTSGVVPAIGELASEPLQVRLAVSLHAADQALRESLMNIAQRHPLDELQRACRAYHAVTRRLITFEYCLMPGINDGREHADQLARFVGRVPSKVNLIPYNPIEGFDAPAAKAEDGARFRAWIQEQFTGEVTVRSPRGRDIDAACGMLHRHRSGRGDSGSASSP